MSYLGNTPTQQAFTPAIDYFSGNGSTVAFTLSRPVASVAQVQAVIENVAQNPSSAFTVSGNTITFTSAPPSGTNNIYVYYTSPITQVTTPSQGSVQPSSLSTGGPSWDTSGNVSITGSITLDSSTADGAQVQLASSGYSNWNLDNYSGTLRAYYGATEQFKVTSAGLLQMNSGYGSPATAYGCRAWVNFNGTGTVAIRASGNVSSISDNGTGNYTVNFTTALPDGNYAAFCQADVSGTNTVARPFPLQQQSAGGLAVIVQSSANAIIDSPFIYVAVFR